MPASRPCTRKCAREKPTPGMTHSQRDPDRPPLPARHRTLDFVSHHISLSLPAFYFSNLQDITTQICIVKGMVFPIVTYRCESWTIKKPESRRTDALKLWCWRRLLRVPWTARRSNQSILKKSVLNIHPILWPPDAKS